MGHLEVSGNELCVDIDRWLTGTGHVISRETADEFRGTLLSLIDACTAFKLRDPLCVRPNALDRARLQATTRVRAEGEPLDAIISDFCENILPASLNFSASTFLAHPDCGNSIAGVAGDVANAFLQQNLSCFDYAPAASIVELALLKELRRVIGYPEGDASYGSAAAGGAFVFGGAGANFSCLLAAREHLKRTLAASGRVIDPRRTRVLGNRPFTHFSLRRSLYMLGLGSRDLTPEQCLEFGVEAESLADVASRNFKLDPDDLERQIVRLLERGEDIMCIFAVAGDSRMMAFDDLERVTAVAERYGIWVHVDACEGGQVLFSRGRRDATMRGVENTDSISMDPHKVLMVPYNLSAFFVRDPQCLSYVVGDAASVINQNDDSLGGFTPVINSKSFISLKLLFMLRHWGWERLDAEIERRHALALRAAEWIRARNDFVLVNLEVQHNAVAFMFVPPDRLSIDDVNRLNRALHETLNMKTRYFVHTFPSRDDGAVVRADRGVIHPLRMMFGNPLSDWQAVVGCLETVVSLGYELLAQPSFAGNPQEAPR